VWRPFSSFPVLGLTEMWPLRMETLGFFAYELRIFFDLCPHVTPCFTAFFVFVLFFLLLGFLDCAFFSPVLSFLAGHLFV